MNVTGYCIQNSKKNIYSGIVIATSEHIDCFENDYCTWDHYFGKEGGEGSPYHCYFQSKCEVK